MGFDVTITGGVGTLLFCTAGEDVFMATDGGWATDEVEDFGWKVAVAGVCFWTVTVAGVCFWTVAVAGVCFWTVAVAGVCFWTVAVARDGFLTGRWAPDNRAENINHNIKVYAQRGHPKQFCYFHIH